ncbi:MAG: NADPH-dependent FMN reductase [Endomicrobiales bacterium]
MQEADLKELGLPLYDQDAEDRGFPLPAQKLKRSIEGCDVLLIALTVQGWRVFPVTGRTRAPLHKVSPLLELRDGKTVYPGKEKRGKEQRQ